VVLDLVRRERRVLLPGVLVARLHVDTRPERAQTAP
jgi:hypothetical protein